MKNFWTSIILLLSLGSVCVAAENKVEAPADCMNCGMNRTKFAHSRMLITYADGSTAGTCSINCAAVDKFANKAKKVTSYKAGDYNSKRLIDANSAVWVIGGKNRGVMSPVAKWAFADRKAADTYIKENGGKPATFEEAFKLAAKELKEDNQPYSHGLKGH
jgi:copper chaperone NosL